MRRAAPAFALFVLSPLVAEFLLGNIAIDALPLVAFIAPLYGGGAILVREGARRTKRGWPALMLLALAYALIEEGLVTQTLFNPSYFGFDLLRPAYIAALGIGGWWTLFVLTLHTVWSIAVPIAVVEAFVPERTESPWLGRWGLVVTGLLFVSGAALNFHFTYKQERFLASPAQLAVTSGVVAAVVVAALQVRDARPSLERAAPGPLWVGAFSFLASSVFLMGAWFLAGWPLVIAYLALYAGVTTAIVRWSRGRGWGAAHRLALAAGALLTYAWHSFVEIPVLGSKGVVDLIGNAVFAAGAVVLLAAAARRLQASVNRISAASR